MTDEVRSEARKYRELAKLVEERIKIRKNCLRKRESSSSDSNTEDIDNKNDTMNVSTTSMEDNICTNKVDSEYLKISSLVVKNLANSKLTPSTATKNKSYTIDTKDTEMKKVRNSLPNVKVTAANNVNDSITECEFSASKTCEFLSKTRFKPPQSTMDIIKSQVDEICEIMSPNGIKSALSNFSSLASFESNNDVPTYSGDILSPSISFKSCLTDDQSPLVSHHKLIRRSTTMNSTPKKSDSPTTPKLVRSNSYTLLAPSPLLVKHLESQGVSLKRSSNSMENLRKPKSKAVLPSSKPILRNRPVVSKSKVSVIPPKKKALSSHTAAKKFSPYDVQLPNTAKRGTKPKLTQQKPQLAPKNVKNHSTPLSSKTNSSSSPKSNLDDNNMKILMSKIEQEQKRKIADLLNKQQIEQRKLEKTFNEQQESLLNQLRQSYSPISNSQHGDSPTSNKSLRSKSFQPRSISQYELSEKDELREVEIDQDFGYLQFIGNHSSRLSKSYPDNSNIEKLNCSRKLFDVAGGTKRKCFTEKEVSVY